MLQPYLSDIVNQCLTLAMKSEDPNNYFLLLRALFRSINGVKCEILYRELQPMLPTLLIGLNKLQVAECTMYFVYYSKKIL